MDSQPFRLTVAALSTAAMRSRLPTKNGRRDLPAAPQSVRPPFRIPHSAFRNPHSAIRNPHSAFRNPQSAIRNPQSAIGRGR
jgi:hypothetical protein